MAPTLHGEHLIQVVRLGAINCYLVREEDGLTLVDTAVPGSAPAILAAVQEIGVPIRRIVVTHAHSDHVGSLDALAGELPEAEVLFPARDARILRGDRSLDANEPGGAKLLSPFYTKVGTSPARELAPGELVGSLEVIAAPGHTPGQVAYLDTRDRSLICADAFTTLGGVATTAKPYWKLPLPGIASWDGPTALASARALTSLEPSRLAPGHGKVVESPVAAMNAAVTRVA